MDDYDELSSAYGRTVAAEQMSVFAQRLSTLSVSGTPLTRWRKDAIAGIMGGSKLFCLQELNKFVRELKDPFDNENGMKKGTISATMGISEIVPSRSVSLIMQSAMDALSLAMADGRGSIRG